jgi:hypothetical protein
VTIETTEIGIVIVIALVRAATDQTVHHSTDQSGAQLDRAVVEAAVIQQITTTTIIVARKL